MAWKPTEIPDQTGRTFVITGANGGLGAVAGLFIGSFVGLGQSVAQHRDT